MVVTLQNRRDQVQAHSFMVGRLQSALLKAEPDLAAPPLRRTGTGLLIGAIVTVLAVGGLVVWAFVSPGGASAWQESGTLVVDRTTGVSYVWAQEKLRPVRNYASARLLLGQDMTVDAVTSSSLEGVPRGAVIGIADAPETLPAQRLSTDAWSVCATTAVAGGIDRPAVLLRIGSDQKSVLLEDDRAVLVVTTEGTHFLVANGRRFRLTASWVSRALGLEESAAVEVSDSWVDVLPAGPDLPQILPEGVGRSGPVLSGRNTVVGQVFVVHSPGATDRYYQATVSGLQTITQTGAQLILGNPATSAAYDGTDAAAIDLSPAALAVASVAAVPGWMSQLPATTLSAVVDPALMPCVRRTPSGATVRTEVVVAQAVVAQAASTVTGTTGDAPTAGEDDRVGASAGDSDGGAPARPSGTDAAITTPAPTPGSASSSGAPQGGADPLRDPVDPADEIDVAAGAGLLARSMPAPAVAGAGFYLITEDGAKYPIASAEAITALGYTAEEATPVPAALLALVPTGPVLDLLGTGGESPAS